MCLPCLDEAASGKLEWNLICVLPGGGAEGKHVALVSSICSLSIRTKTDFRTWPNIEMQAGAPRSEMLSCLKCYVSNKAILRQPRVGGSGVGVGVGVYGWRNNGIRAAGGASSLVHRQWSLPR